MLRQIPRRRVIAAGVVTTVATLLAGCTGGASGGANQPVTGLRLMAPAKPGGGWHQSAQAMQDVLLKEKLATGAQVFNVEGAGGVTGLKQMAGEKDDKLLMIMGQVMVGGILNAKSDKTLKDTTPIAKLTGEALVIVVPAAQTEINLQDFLTTWKQDPKGTVITGGSAGGADQILAGLVADEVGIDPGQVNYVANSGGGEAVAKLLSGEVKAGISGVSEFSEHVKSGKLRAVAVSGDKRSTLLPDTKTLKEQGVPISYLNWRGVVARPGLSEGARQTLVDMVTKMRNSEAWKQTLKAKDWEDAWATGADFSKFIDEDEARVKKMLAEIGGIK
ncbi:tripartite tricarboxylate transporter substrate-binding protein [Crossiella sp. CA-258035]|uniref:Bug family tripartite tricarboxylate transporter substrate binding protein n=1 Tax=Crossiella sp. CA-258035 TaxID=2981138 RepID=UPI0024BCB40A|nr:tripartite tricarboxylate transporter substrate-binding protein [Crossiella sp. CA-258035]WHT19972.1 tripartite tricarboxylate transporter substrate-binding protein [Crossiella sp. CA-258035]